MVDIHTKEQRSKNMAAVKSKNTKPELMVRSYLHNKGFRFRLSSKGLPCRPDIILPKYKTVIFVHGCFWHRHKCQTSFPKTNKIFWGKKFEDNISRDKKNYIELKNLCWNVIIICECEITPKHLTGLIKNLI